VLETVMKRPRNSDYRMRRTGVAELPLHHGHVPAWLLENMRKLSRAIMEVMVRDLGTDEVLRRLADPYWFQSFGCVIGFDWHSSGLTTVVTGVLRDVLTMEDHGIAVVGGKGSASRRTPTQITELGELAGFSPSRIDALKRASKLSAKVDNAVLQDGYEIYHHAFAMSERGQWAVVQQGINTGDGTARRYHWIGEGLRSFVEEPHSGIAGEARRDVVLDMTSSKSRGARKVSVEIAREDPGKVLRLVNEVQLKQGCLDMWVHPEAERPLGVGEFSYLKMPRRVNWKVLKRLYEMKPQCYEEIIEIGGVGSGVVRALALISTLVYGEAPSWQDPVRFSFAVGGKDGVPFPVDRKAMDGATEFLKQSLLGAELAGRDRLQALKRLATVCRYPS